MASRYKARLASGEWVGPEAFNAGPMINNADLPRLATAARSPEEMARVVSAQSVEAGTDWIKLVHRPHGKNGPPVGLFEHLLVDLIQDVPYRAGGGVDHLSKHRQAVISSSRRRGLLDLLAE